MSPGIRLLDLIDDVIALVYQSPWVGSRWIEDVTVPGSERKTVKFDFAIPANFIPPTT